MHGRVWSCIVSTGQTWTVGVTGATGYAGGEVCRLLAGHPNLRLAGVHANSSAGRRLGELQPHLLPLADMAVQPTTPDAGGHDVVFLALPHGESAALAAQLPDDPWSSTAAPTTGSTTRPPGSAATAAEHAGTWPYGLPELPGQRDAAAPAPGGSRSPAATRPRSPSPWRPLLAAGPGRARAWSSSPPPAPPAPGKSAKPHLLGSEVMGSVAPYGVGGAHRHTPEMIQNLSQAAGGAGRVSFTPALAPMPRGILATCTAQLRARRRRRRRRGPPTRRRTPTSRSCTCCPRASGRRTAAGARRQHRRAAGRRRRGRRPAGRRRRASTT